MPSLLTAATPHGDGLNLKGNKPGKEPVFYGLRDVGFEEHDAPTIIKPQVGELVGELLLQFILPCPAFRY